MSPVLCSVYRHLVTHETLFGPIPLVFRCLGFQEELLVGSEIISPPSLARGKQVKTTVMGRSMLRVRERFATVVLGDTEAFSVLVNIV